VLSAYRQHSWFDQIGAFVSMVGYSVPTFFTGVVLIVVFSVKLSWFPSVYDTNLQVVDWASFIAQVRQMFLPVLVLTLFNTSQISRFVRASMLDNLHQDYVRTARAKASRNPSSCLSTCCATASSLLSPCLRSAYRRFSRARSSPSRSFASTVSAIADHRHSGRRPPSGADAHLRVRRADRAVQPGGRCALRPARPEDQL